MLLKSGARGAQPCWGRTVREGQQARHLRALSPRLAYSSVSRGHRDMAAGVLGVYSACSPWGAVMLGL